MSQTNAKTERVYLWDNVKALLIFLVVFGHAILPFRLRSDFIGGAYIWLNTFHMPLFIFVTGLFSKRTVNAEKLNHTKIISYIMIFYFMKITVSLCYFLASGNFVFYFLSESGTPWYIFVTAMYLVITHLLKNLNPKKVFTVILILSLAAGYCKDIGATLMLSRMIAFYPLFYLGYLTDSDKLIKELRRPPVRVISLLFFIVFTFLAFYRGRDFYNLLNPLFTNAGGYIYLPADFRAFGPLLRMGTYLFSAAVSASLIAIIPAKKIPLISYIGQNTLPVYALHRQLIYFYQFSPLPALLLTMRGSVIFAIIFAASAVLTILLATKPFRYILYPFTDYTKWSKKLLKWFKK